MLKEFAKILINSKKISLILEEFTINSTNLGPKWAQF